MSPVLHHVASCSYSLLVIPLRLRKNTPAGESGGYQMNPVKNTRSRSCARLGTPRTHRRTARHLGHPHAARREEVVATSSTLLGCGYYPREPCGDFRFLKGEIDMQPILPKLRARLEITPPM